MVSVSTSACEDYLKLKDNCREVSLLIIDQQNIMPSSGSRPTLHEQDRCLLWSQDGQDHLFQNCYVWTAAILPGAMQRRERQGYWHFVASRGALPKNRHASHAQYPKSPC